MWFWKIFLWPIHPNGYILGQWPTLMGKRTISGCTISKCCSGIITLVFWGILPITWFYPRTSFFGIGSRPWLGPLILTSEKLSSWIINVTIPHFVHWFQDFAQLNQGIGAFLVSHWLIVKYQRVIDQWETRKHWTWWIIFICNSISRSGIWEWVSRSESLRPFSIYNHC